MLNDNTDVIKHLLHSIILMPQSIVPDTQGGVKRHSNIGKKKKKSI